VNPPHQMAHLPPPLKGVSPPPQKGGPDPSGCFRRARPNSSTCPRNSAPPRVPSGPHRSRSLARSVAGVARSVAVVGIAVAVIGRSVAAILSSAVVLSARTDLFLADKTMSRQTRPFPDGQSLFAADKPYSVTDKTHGKYLVRAVENLFPAGQNLSNDGQTIPPARQNLFHQDQTTARKRSYSARTGPYRKKSPRAVTPHPQRGKLVQSPSFLHPPDIHA
jgi:hypothetical protein